MTRSAAELSNAPDVLGLIDFCKGVAIVGVVGVHAVRGWFGWQGVHVFLVLSGFALTHACATRHANGAARIDWVSWLRRRAKRILPAYWLVSVLGFLLVCGVRSGMPRSTATPLPVQPLTQLALDLSLLRNGSYRAFFGEPNAALWFVPLVFGFYLAFPALFAIANAARRHGTLLGFVATAALIECVYRAIAIYRFDGMPVAYGNGFAWGLPALAAPLDRIPPDAPFQLWAPFGFFPSRIGEFALGMAAAMARIDGGPRFVGAVLSARTLGLGAAAWVFGNVLLYAGRWGWIVADLPIAFGLTLILVFVADRLRRRAVAVFAGFARIGRWSYAIFLSHLVFGQTYALAFPLFGDKPALRIGLLLAALLATVSLTVLLVRLEAS